MHACVSRLGGDRRPARDPTELMQFDPAGVGSLRSWGSTGTEARGKRDDMQLTIDSNEPLERVLDVVGSLYGVRLAVISDVPPAPTVASPPLRRRAATKARPARSRGSALPARSHRSRHPASTTSPLDSATLRRWAQANGYPVKDRGRIPASVVAAYDQRDRVAE